MRNPPVALWVLGALLGAAGPALAVDKYPACTREPTAKEEEAARGAFAAGRAAYAEGDYPRAIDYWRDAYRRACNKHDMLKNLALAHELSGKPEDAAVALRTYLERVPEAPDHDEVTRKLESLEARAESEKSAAEEPPPPSAPAPPAAVTPPAEPSGPAAVKPEAQVRGPTNVPPLVLAGAGLLLTAVGSVGYLMKSGSVNEFVETDCPHYRCTSETVDRANAAYHARNAFGAVAIGGAAIAVTGGAWYLVRPRKAGSAAARVEPRVAPGFAGLSLRGSF